MFLQPSDEMEIPTQTKEVARCAFPDGNIYMTLRGELGTVFEDEQFRNLYPQRGQLADAVRSRIDWKSILGLELNDPGFHYSILSEFRSRLIDGGADQLLFDTILKISRKRGLLKERGKQRTDSTHIVAAVRDKNRIELVGESFFQVLDLLAQIGLSGWSPWPSQTGMNAIRDA